MDTINFICRWEYPKEKSWSGTHQNILNELKKIYKVNQIELKNRKIVKILKKFKLFKLAWYIETILNRKYIKKMAQGTKLFMFDAIYVGKEYSHYIYIDLSYSLLLDLYKKDIEKYKSSSFNLTYSNLKFLTKQQNKYFSKATCVFSMSEYLSIFLKKENPDINITTVYAGVNVKPEQNIKKEMGYKILFVGKDYKRKSGQEVYDAFLLLKKENPRFELFFAGPQINPFDNVDGYHFLGELSPDQLKSYFELCNIYCMPSKFEAFGIVFCEALLYDMPIIVYDGFEMQNIINSKYGRKIKEITAENIKNTILEIIEDKNINDIIYNDLDELSKKYSWKNVATLMSKKINEIEGE